MRDWSPRQLLFLMFTYALLTVFWAYKGGIISPLAHAAVGALCASRRQYLLRQPGSPNGRNARGQPRR